LAKLSPLRQRPSTRSLFQDRLWAWHNLIKSDSDFEPKLLLQEQQRLLLPSFPNLLHAASTKHSALALACMAMAAITSNQ